MADPNAATVLAARLGVRLLAAAFRAHRAVRAFYAPIEKLKNCVPSRQYKLLEALTQKMNKFEIIFFFLNKNFSKFYQELNDAQKFKNTIFDFYRFCTFQ